MASRTMPSRKFLNDFPAHDHQSLVIRMNQTVADGFRSCTELDVQHDGCHYLECFPKWFKRNLGWIMFVADRNDALLLRTSHRVKFERVAKQAGVSGVRVQKVHGPILCQFSIVSERASKLDLECPVSRN